MKKYDAVIIGSGPAGLTAALYLLRARRKVLIIEKLTPGGQVLLTERIENYPGFPEGIAGFELVDAFVKQVEGYAPEKLTGEVREIKVGQTDHVVQLTDEQEIKARVIIIASGARWRRLGAPGEVEFTGKGVSYCAVCDGNFFKDQVVVCIGGGDTALEESLYLAKIAKKVYLIHRRDKFRGTKIYQEKVFAHPKIEIIWDSVVKEFKGQDFLSAVRIKNLKTGEEQDLSVNGAFVFVGMDPNTDFVPPQIKLDARGFIVTNDEMRTEVPGIFAAGDVRVKSCRQVATAVGDGACAGYNASIYLEQLNE
ncbi:MAG: thioredoxin-disulfide reductase [Desulfonauticus sp.]|nr:thioredoxin-disulfide reductase [Desulfonauticus sp.]